MHLLHIVSTLDPKAGGPQTALRMLVEHQPAGYTSEVVTTDAPGTAFLSSYPVPAHGTGEPGGSWRSPQLLTWLRANRHRFDGAIMHGLWSYPGIAVRRALAGHTPYMVFPHGMLDPYFKRAFPLKHLKKLPFWVLAEYWNLRLADRVLFTTELERDLAAESFPWMHRWHAEVTSLGTTPPPADEAHLRSAFLAAFPELEHKRFLLYLGRIHPKKGADLLLDAFTRLAPSFPEAHLVMAGPGADDPWASGLRASLAPEIAARIHWPGMLQGDEKWGAFAASEAFVLPSHQENFGIAVVEALASSRPVLITHPVNISPEIAADGAGLVSDDTLAGIESMLHRWLTLSATERQTMGEQALRTYNQRYDMRRNTAPILRLFETIRREKGLPVH